MQNPITRSEQNRDLIKFYQEILRGNWIYRNKKEYWYNPRRKYDNHHISMYVGTLIKDQTYRHFKSQNVEINDLWISEIDEFWLYRTKSLEINTWFRTKYPSRLLFDLKYGNPDEIKLKNDYIAELTNTRVQSFILNINKALEIYQLVLEKINKFLN